MHIFLGNALENPVLLKQQGLRFFNGQISNCHQHFTTEAQDQVVVGLMFFKITFSNASETSTITRDYSQTTPVFCGNTECIRHEAISQWSEIEFLLSGMQGQISLIILSFLF